MRNPFKSVIVWCTTVMGLALLALAFVLLGRGILPWEGGNPFSHELLQVAILPAQIVVSEVFNLTGLGRLSASGDFIAYCLTVVFQGLFYFGVGVTIQMFVATFRSRRQASASPEGILKRPSYAIEITLAAIPVLLFVGGFFLKRSIDDSVSAASCANHIIQLRSMLYGAALEHPEFVLPATSDTRQALLPVSDLTGDDNRNERWLNGSGSACPESYRRSREIGYVYVGDGLTLGEVTEKHILILFCPGENHRRSNQHCHGWDDDGLLCCRSNAEMREHLREAIARGESGEVNYSPRAMEVLRGELKKRLSTASSKR